ncbi:VWA domain-containing protein [Bacteroidales bacterium OttesenSCG-928-K03]|nr:VWA domain-containing protein [Odoribacter sp. OttesenSCG-928-L07]MDL2238653.1 VWA domain-containing protein [Bacteroidales bacterium OttesenSCG-928-L14]MDL2240288.1 VWA domain-containing protein [Bacteroidales bacterium OttesenSCG-928-K22]MDL2242998.1 VWA domain-containing protein [Bacteroidales bacterium OttesenSCG-928-K03]
MEFANPECFYLLLLIPLIVVFYILKLRKSYPVLQISDFHNKGSRHVSFKEILLHILFGVEMIVLALLIVALARPQSSEKNKTMNVEGIDIVMTMDVSGSMLAEDFQPNRLEAAKKVAINFIDERPNDRIGLVVFAGESFTQCPLTTDHAVLKNLFKEIKIGMIEDGTAIGSGLATSVLRLKESDALSRVIILLTDGVNNTGSIDPVSAAEIAKTFGIRVYTVGVGTNGTAPYPAQDIFGNKRYQQVEVNIDEDLMRQVSSITGGKYFRATDNNSLARIYEEIDKLEKSKIEVYEYEKKNEEFFNYALYALILLCLDFIIRKFVLRILP